LSVAHPRASPAPPPRCPSRLPPPPRPTLFPYTTLFRSHDGDAEAQELRDLGIRQAPDVVQHQHALVRGGQFLDRRGQRQSQLGLDRKSTRLNSSHVAISYAVFCLKKKTGTRHALLSAPY